MDLQDNEKVGESGYFGNIFTESENDIVKYSVPRI